MKTLFLILLIKTSIFSQTLSFGAISTVDKSIMEKKLKPIISYISKTIKQPIKFQTGFDYLDTIEKFKLKKYDLGFIGPAPFLLAMQNTDKPLQIIVGLNTKNNGYFHSVIIVKNTSSIKSLEDLKGKSFAFGSPQSTLSYFMPMYLLKKQNLDKKLSNIVFLGKHDRVAKYIIMGKYDAGGIKQSVANKYKKYIKIIAKTQDVPDFIIVASTNMPKQTVQKIREALLKPEAQKLAKFIKPSATGFIKREEKDYDILKNIMLYVDKNSLK